MNETSSFLLGCLYMCLLEMRGVVAELKKS